jgi:hypothetical protein
MSLEQTMGAIPTSKSSCVPKIRRNQKPGQHAGKVFDDPYEYDLAQGASVGLVQKPRHSLD